MKRKPAVLLGILALALILIAVWLFWDRSPGYDHGIHVRFEEEMTAEAELLILEQYENAVILDGDDPILHDYTLAFPDLPERKVMKAVSSLNNTDGVHDASYVHVLTLPAE